MNKQQIKAELRRSACEDEIPYYSADIFALFELATWYEEYEFVSKQSIDFQRTFFLLVAEAL